MAHFNFETSLTNAIKMDTAMERGPLMRWQRKAMEAGLNRLAISDASQNQGPRSANTPVTPLSALTPKSPTKTPGKVGTKKTPSKRANSKTPSKGQNTPHPQQPDRFIPNRSAMDLDGGYHRLLNNSENVDPVTGEMSPRTYEYRRKVCEAAGKESESKILAFKLKPAAAREGHMNNLKVLYSGAPNLSSTKPGGLRHVPRQAEQILDAPGVLDDYYLHLLDWSSQNQMTTALAHDVFLWNPQSGDITQLPVLEQVGDEYVASVKFIKEGNVLAVGTSTGTVQLWDVTVQKKIRTMSGHPARVGVLSWNSYILSSGSRSGAIHNHDVRVADHHVGSFLNHQQEVCGLAWSHDGRFLASGGNDNLINIWDATLSHDDVTPIYTLTQHQAAVKALAWCPWQSTLLASGGGTADRHIRFWSVSSGQCLHSTDTASQVSSIIWSPAHRELVSGHGYVQNQLIIWKYPTMNRVANLTGHEERILSLTMSPDGAVVASMAADETIRMWRCFDYSEKKKTAKTANKDQPKMGILTRGIR